MKTILIVDDRPINREVLTILLDEQNYQLIEADNGIQAKEIITKNQIDLIITDIAMPRMDGIALAKELQENFQLSKIPIIFYSAIYQDSVRAELANLTNVKYLLTKPCDPEIILNTIEAALDPYKTSLSLEMTPISLEKETYQSKAEHNYYKNEKINLRLSNLIEIGIDMSLEHDLEKLIHITCKSARQFLDACYAGIMIQNSNNKNFQVFNISRDNQINSALVEINNPMGLLKEILIEEKSLCIHSPVFDLEKIGLHNVSLPITSFLNVPIKTLRNSYGNMYFINKFNSRYFNVSDQRFMMTIADKFAIYYENLILYLKIQQHTRQLEDEIAQRKQSEIALRQSEKNFRQLAENIQEVFWVTSIDCKKFFYISPLYEKLRGLPVQTLYEDASEWFKNIAAEDLQFVLGSFNKFTQGEKQIDIEYKIVRPDGTICWIHNRGFRVFDEESGVDRIAGIATDITERKKLEELAFRHKYHLELAELSRVNSMGEMASTLAHEINQPLTAILTYSQTCIRKLQSDDFLKSEVLEGLKLVTQQAERAGAIIHRMKNFVRKGNLFIERLNINDVLSNLFPLIQYEAKDTATHIDLNLVERLPLVYIDRISIEQVILNITRNAIEAMKDSNTIKPYLEIKTLLESNNMVSISIIDNGPGFPKEMTESLFTPYVTTKPSGTGMGLAISRTIIEAHGGQLSATSELQNTCFRFTLPSTTELRKIS